MSDAHDVYDLGALADALQTRMEYRKLVGVIRRAIDVYSLCTDLVMAEDSCAAILSLPPDKGEADSLRAITESALICNAVVLYARATKTSSKTRRGFDLSSRFSEEERTIHDEICDLRDDAVAHFGAGGSYRGDWKGETAVLHVTERDARIGVVNRRLVHDRSLVQRIKGQVAVAKTLMSAVYAERIRLVTEDVFDRIENDAEFMPLVRKHPIDLANFLRTSEAAAAALSASKQHKGVVSHSPP